MVGRSRPFLSSVVETGKSRSPTPIARVTESLTFSPTMGTPLITVFMLIVPIPTRSIELFGVIM
ncbi:hypothetical protein LINPERHAP2_LOCUS5657 [Linum perenne]